MRRQSLVATILGSLLLTTLGCYRPSIEEGAFVCGPGGACPSGFSCHVGRCYKASLVGDGGRDGGADAPVCLGPLSCSPPTEPVSGPCDPVCQTGCACNQRCTHGNKTSACGPPPPSPLALYATCDPGNDTCQRGAICLEEETNPRCNAHCYRFCRADSDCGATARCLAEVREAPDKLFYKVCSAPIETCTPVGPNPRCAPGNTNRPWPAFACYMLSMQNPELGVCECAGSLPEGAECVTKYSCVPGAECIQPDAAPARCRRLCTIDPLLPLASSCPLGQPCVPFGRSRLGYCP